MERQREFSQKMYLRIMDIEREISSGMAAEYKMTSDLKAEIIDKLMLIHKDEIELKERSGKGIWQTAILMSRLVGGTETEWAQPFIRAPRQFTLKDRQ